MYKLRREFKKRNYSDIEVGTTETFQGREKRVIIVTTVRSQTNMMDYDKKFRLGFLREPKRFNVIMTRAQSKVCEDGDNLKFYFRIVGRLLFFSVDHRREPDDFGTGSQLENRHRQGGEAKFLHRLPDKVQGRNVGRFPSREAGHREKRSGTGKGKSSMKFWFFFSFRSPFFC